MSKRQNDQEIIVYDEYGGQNPSTQTAIQQKDVYETCPDLNKKEDKNVESSKISINLNSITEFNKKESSSKSQMCTKTNLIYIGVVLLIIICSSLAYMLTRETRIPQKFQHEVLFFNGNHMQMITQQVPPKDGQKPHSIMAYGIHKGDTQILYSNTQSTLRQLKNDLNKILYQFIIPAFSIFDKFGNQHKQKQPFKEWLGYFNQHPRETIDRLVETIGKQFSQENSFKDGTEIRSIVDVDFVNITESVWAVVEYDSVAENFHVVMNPTEQQEASIQQQSQETESNKNLQSEVPQQASETTDTSLLSQSLITTVIQQTVYYIKRKAQKSIQTFKENNDEIKKINEALTNPKTVDEDWQLALTQCSIVKNLVFRCPLNLVEKLVSGMNEQERTQPDRNYLLVYGFSIILEEKVGHETL